MALITKDQFFELWYPTSYWAQQFGGAGDPNNRRNARESPNGSRQFDAAWESYNRDQIAAENPRSVIDTPYTFNEPAPIFTQWSGPCYDSRCQQLRASIKATEEANYASWQTRKAQAEAAEQKRLYEVALFQEAEVKAQQYEAEQATAFLTSEQKRIQQELETEKQRISQEQIQEQSNIESQIAAARLAAQQEQAAIKSQFETDRASIQEQQKALQTQFEQEKATTEKNIAETAAETERQQLITKKQTAIQKKAASSTGLAQQQQQTTVEPQQAAKKKRAMIGQPGVAVTRFNPRIGIGGYGGTASGRVNPTGLNI